jgi:hypothetical protein
MGELQRRRTYPGATADVPFEFQTRSPDPHINDFLGESVDPGLRATILAAAERGMSVADISDQVGASKTLVGAVISAAKTPPKMMPYLGGGKPGDWMGTMEKQLDDLVAEGGHSAQDIADAINAQHGTSLTANAVRQKLSQVRPEKTPVRARWPEEAKTWLQSP